MNCSYYIGVYLDPYYTKTDSFSNILKKKEMIGNEDKININISLFLRKKAIYSILFSEGFIEELISHSLSS